MTNVFGPMSANYCNIFLILSAVYLALTVILGAGLLLSFTKKISFYHRVYMTGGFLTYLLGYITHRIFYNMCLKTA
jgi:hypothetical protein